MAPHALRLLPGLDPPRKRGDRRRPLRRGSCCWSSRSLGPRLCFNSPHWARALFCASCAAMRL
eukprot:7009311-Lingulodinium_polyedra.AAC.1